jgi:pimeloyl-ACP methyl ester carboxylesterase
VLWLGNSATLLQVHGTIQFGDATLHYESAGSGHPVLFIHAGVTDSRMWNDQFEEIEGFRLIRFDMRGFGRSKLGSQPFSHRDDALALLDHLDVEKACLVGCSIGANTALQIAAAAPDRVAGMVLVGADAPGFDPGIDYESPEWPEALRAFESGDLSRVAELEAEMWLAGRGRSASQLDPDVVELFVEMDLVALENESTREALDTTQPLEDLPDLAVPVLVLVGEHDIPQLHASAAHLAERLSDHEPVVMLGTAHLPPMDRPDVFNQALLSFLGTLSS